MAIKFEWATDLSVGDETIDNQHRKLLDQVNKLLNALIERKSLRVISETITYLDEYVNEHFTYEEEYMEKHHYPESDQHKKLHQGFIKNYNEFKDELKKKGPSNSLTLKVESFIGSWWVRHIGTDDHKYYLYIKEQSEA